MAIWRSRLVRFEIAAADELIAHEYGHAVIAVLSLMCRLEDLEYLLEREQHLDAFAVPEQWVERREEYALISRRPRLLET